MNVEIFIRTWSQIDGCGFQRETRKDYVLHAREDAATESFYQSLMSHCLMPGDVYLQIVNLH